MNYFEFYDLPISFNPDQTVLKQKFYALSKKFHPDFYINEDQAKQDEVLEQATLNNKAFQTIKDPQKRLHYILKLKDKLTEGENYALPQDFLMEMMDVNEALMDLEFEPEASKIQAIKSEVMDLEQDLAKELNDLTAAFDAASPSEQEALLVSIKDIYFRNKYLWRIKESIARLSA